MDQSPTNRNYSTNKRMSADKPAPTYDLIALGEALVDLISTKITTSISEAESYQRYLGGQVTNLAVNMARLGKRTALAACIGEDGFGHFINQQLTIDDLNTEYVQYTNLAPTSFSIITRHTYTPDFIISRGADTYLQYSPKLESAITSSRIVHTSAFAISRHPARETILQALHVADREGCLISFDPNYHPNIWPDSPDVIKIIQDIFHLIDIAKPSLDDCTRLFGPGMDPKEYADRFLRWGAEIVALTLGAEGVLLATSDGKQYLIHSNPTTVADVTGAGDAFWAGFLASLLNGLSPLESAQYGQILAEIKIGVVGPITQIPDRESLNQRLQTVKYTPLSQGRLDG